MEDAKLQSSIDIHFKNLEPVISPWHSKLETAQKGIPPHITLLWPWKNSPIEPNDVEILKTILEDTKSFSVTFDKIKYFPNGTIFLSCEDVKMIQKTMKKIFEVFPECKPYNGEFRNPIPHVTIAKIPDQNKFDEVYNEISAVVVPKLPITCQVDKIMIMEELETKNWKITERIKLQK